MMGGETMLIINILLLLAACIDARGANTKRVPESMQQEQWAKTTFNLRGYLTSKHHEERTNGLVYSPGLHDEYTASSRPAYKEGDSSSKKVKNCPTVCYCELKQDPNFPVSTLKLVVKDCISDPYDQLPKLFDMYLNVSSLELNNCHLSRLPQDAIKLQHLNVLYLIRNEFRDIPNQLQQLPLLWGFFVKENRAEHIRLDNITKLEKLQVLEMSESRIDALPEEIGKIRSLRFLNVSYNQILSLPTGIAALSGLVSLDLRKNNLKVIPVEINNLTMLMALYLDYNDLIVMPSSIGNLKRLQMLSLQGNRLRTLPLEIMNLNGLVILVLDKNLLISVPAVPEGQLSMLSLAQNMIQVMPCGILHRGHLQLLDLSHNSLKSFNCRSFNQRLELLDLSHNALTELSCYHRLTSLISLDLSHNRIWVVPAYCRPFSASPFMARLDLSFNKIKTLPLQAFCGHDFKGAFQVLSFRNNIISSISTSDADLLSCFKRDAVIDLAYNNILTLDSWPLLLAKKNPIYLDVTGNNISMFLNYGHMFLPTFQSGTTFLFQNNWIKHFMDIFNGWQIIANTTENLNTLLTNIHFDLAGNPLVCDCVDYEVYRYIQTLRPEQYNNLVCHEPLFLRGLNPRYIPLGSFVCNDGANCPFGCHCVMVPHSRSINVTCNNYVETDIPETLPDLPKENYWYHLDICNQNLREVTSRSYLEKATEIILSNNSISMIKISPSYALQHVRILYLDGNLLQRLPESMAEMTNETAAEIKIGGNPWVCDCKVLVLKNWIRENYYVVKDKDQIRCHSPKRLAGKRVLDITRSMVCPD